MAVASTSAAVASSGFAPDGVNACMLSTGNLRTRTMSCSMSRDGGCLPPTAPRTSLIVFITGSRSASGNGAWICGRGSCRWAAWCSRTHLASCAACFCSAAFKVALIGFKPTPESSFASCRSSACFDRIEVSCHSEPGQRRYHLILRGRLHRLAHAGGVVFELVDGAAMGERVYPRRAVGPAHDLGDAAAVIDTFERIGQRLALETLRVSEHVADGAAGKLRVVKRQHDIRPQHALALSDDHLPGGVLRHAWTARDELLGLCRDECLSRLCPLWTQAARVPGL